MKNNMYRLAIFLVIASCIVLPLTAAAKETQLPTQWTYVKEWVALNIFSLSAQAKVKTIDKQATQRATDIQNAATSNATDTLNELVNRYTTLVTKENSYLQKDTIPTTLTTTVQQNEINRQKTLSIVRQDTTKKDVKDSIVTLQEQAVNSLKQTLEKKDVSQVQNFTDSVVSVWRDPQGSIAATEEKATRVYAEGTSGQGVTGVVIDGGTAKIDTATNGDLKIEYAAGTGPNVVVGDAGEVKWKIQQPDGTVVESYTAGSQVIIGQTDNTAGNVVVNTVNGQTTSGQAQIIVGDAGGTGGQKIEGNATNGAAQTVIGGPGTSGTKVETGSPANTAQ